MKTSTRTLKLNGTPLRTLVAGAALASAAVMMTGCGTGVAGKTGIGGTSTALATHMTGKIYGGQQPVVGATIQIYQVGSTGYGAASTSTPLLTGAPVTSGAGGVFDTGTVTCPSSGSTQVYLTATGGDPGFGPNSAVALVAALGYCSNLAGISNVTVNEVTTIAAAYALDGFASDLTHVGSPAANSFGLQLAMTNATVLANYTTGTAGAMNPQAGVTVPTAEINELADILAGCINTSGPSSSGCQQLLGATGAADTFGASLAIAKNPGSAAVTALYTMATPTAPFQPVQNTSQPKDYTIGVKTTAGGNLNAPYGIALDANNIAYVTNEGGSTLVSLGQSNPGLFTTPYTATGLFGPQGVSVDKGGNVWVANTAGNSLLKFPSSFFTLGSATAYTSGLTAPSAVANDSNGNVFVANFNGSSVAGFDNSGTPLSGSPFFGNGSITVPQSIAVGPAGNVYVTSGTNGFVVKLTNAGALSGTFNDGTLQGPAGLAVDVNGNIAVSGSTTGNSVGPALSEFTTNGTYVASSPAVAGINNPQGVASDGVSFYVANSVTGGGLAKFPAGATVPTSPAAGYGTLNTPVGVAVDRTGCVWVTNQGDNTVTKFFGLSTPVLTPLAANVGP